MAIYISSQSVQDNINYKDCRYVGFTNEPIDANYVIQYGDQKLKVLYTVPGRRTAYYLRTKRRTPATNYICRIGRPRKIKVIKS